MSVASASPMRNPDLNSPKGMTTRGWVLIVLNILIPGSAQLLTGSRRLGRFGVRATFILWLLALGALALFFVWQPVFLTLVSTPLTLWVVSAVLVFYAVLWVVLTLDTLRLVRLVKALPAARVWIAAFATLVLVAVAGGSTYAAYLATTAGSAISEIFIAAPPKPAVDGRYNILLLGADSGPDREGTRPDSITVASIDAETGAAVLIGLPRNLNYAPFSEGSPLAEQYPYGYGADDVCEVDVCLLNSIYTEVDAYGQELYPNAVAEGSEPGIEAMRDAAEGITGLEIQYYLLVEMQGFAQLIDSLGGVTIVAERGVPIHSDAEYTEVAEVIGPGEVHLDGYHALWYVRSRGDSSDYERIARQHQIEQAVVAQFTPSNILSKFQGIAAAGTQLVKTDVPQSALGFFVALGAKTKDLPVDRLGLTPESEIDPEDPDYEYIHELVAEKTAPRPINSPEN